MVGSMRQNLRRACAAILLCTLWSGAGTAGAAGLGGRADAPPAPKGGEYQWQEPKDWTPPTMEELQGWKWEPGRITTGFDVARERYAKEYGGKAALGDLEALALPNDGAEANHKILSALGRPPKSPDEVDYEATVNRWIMGAPETMNAVLQSSKYEQEIVAMFAVGVMTFDHDMKPFAEGELVKEWKRNPVADLVVLRDDVVWEDGTPVTAYDVEFSYHVILDLRINVPAARSGTDELKWVKAYDAHTLVYFHKEALVTNIWNVNFPVIPKHIYSPGLVEDPSMRASEWNVYWNTRPLSGGAYRVKEHEPGQSIMLERREEWYQDKTGKAIREKPYVKNFRFRIIQDQNTALLAFKKGEVDEMLLASRQWANETADTEFKARGNKLSGVEWTFYWIGWNQKPIPDNPFFKDKDVRLAMSYAFNYEEYIKEIQFNLVDPAGSQFHPASWMHNPAAKPFTQDLDKADELLDKAGWIDSDKDGIRDKTIDGKKWKFEFTMLASAGGTGEKAAILMKEDLSNIGVKMQIKLLEWATFLQSVQEHRYEACTMAFGTGTDPDTAKNLWMTREYEQGRNYVGYSNPRVDELFEAGQREFDPEKRKAIYQEIDLILNQDQPYTFLCFRRTFWAFGKRIRGYNFSPREPFAYTPGPFSVWVPKAAA